ncbi:response regulator [Blastopirellula retiformator]|uniref:Polar-differentiation response regulator DivK n=1 Tax=Blastopirellula retiformator TaxID=2527970 RepID=A0A5C5VPJ4_9BACT|nr:response regulator [Blastopirellula retiformator]TWT39629.1 Polar-differentiation response regulator DivK [Blastopirellula retiformator]
MQSPAKPNVPSSTDDAKHNVEIDDIFAMCSAGADDALWGEDFERLEPGSERPWVLTIEDDDDFAAMLRIKLEEVGFRTIRAGVGMEGYRRAFFDAPKAILLDYELPMGQGDYVLGRLKESPATASIPVIVLTGRRDTPLERKMRMLGADEFLTKPVDWNRLTTTLTDLVPA